MGSVWRAEGTVAGKVRRSCTGGRRLLCVQPEADREARHFSSHERVGVADRENERILPAARRNREPGHVDQVLLENALKFELKRRVENRYSIRRTELASLFEQFFFVPRFPLPERENLPAYRECRILRDLVRRQDHRDVSEYSNQGVVLLLRI